MLKSMIAACVALSLTGCGNAQRQQLTVAHDRYVDEIMTEVHGGHMTMAQAADAIREWNALNPGSRAQPTVSGWALVAAVASGFAEGAASAPVYHPNYNSPAYSPAVYTPQPVAMTSPSLSPDMGYLHNQPAPETHWVPYSAVSKFMPGMKPDGTTKE